MNILKRIQMYAGKFPERVAFRCGIESLTYRQLWERSDRLAAWILRNGGPGRDPVAVYGHKHPWMLVCFLACVKAGRAYCPIDISVPDGRVELILQALPSNFLFAAEPMSADAGGKRMIGRAELAVIVGDPDEKRTGCAEVASIIPKGQSEKQADDGVMRSEESCESAAAGAVTRSERTCEVPESGWVSGAETYYIIFTSGSTGTPKGVQISADCLNHYLDWSVGLGSSAEQKQGQVFLNQAPFSFDLSVMDLYTSLASGGTLFCLEKSVQGDYRALMKSLKESGANVWVSTPSFADVCLSEQSFGAELMPGLEVFLFCGETLTNRTAHRLQERFANAKIVNTYGPTESTVAVTDVLVTRALEARESPLPVGKAKPGTTIEIRDADGTVLPDGEKGEIIIIGDTVSTGYYGRPDLTEKAFFTVADENESRAAEAKEEACKASAEYEKTAGEAQAERAGLSGSCMRAYRTGDKGYKKNGMLYYCGRIDLQVKLHGYRIELEDIESNICKLSEVEQAVVVPNSRGGKVSSLTAYIVKRAGDRPDTAAGEREETARLREALRAYLPDYMIPKKMVFLSQIPMTNNGKADRKALAAQNAGAGRRGPERPSHAEPGGQKP